LEKVLRATEQRTAWWKMMQPLTIEFSRKVEKQFRKDNTHLFQKKK